jgi:hypothetical protein
MHIMDCINTFLSTRHYHCYYAISQTCPLLQQATTFNNLIHCLNIETVSVGDGDAEFMVV